MIAITVYLVAAVLFFSSLLY